ncbi:MAG TPA: hypothetical protein VL625_07135 [Patescibacteria group bacterium]|nr:hypothetical protein [Patescibacteria group bacterium]
MVLHSAFIGGNTQMMNQYLEWFAALKEPVKKQVIAAAKWGDGPYTRRIFKLHLPMLKAEEVPEFIRQIQSTEA